MEFLHFIVLIIVLRLIIWIFFTMIKIVNLQTIIRIVSSFPIKENPNLSAKEALFPFYLELAVPSFHDFVVVEVDGNPMVEPD